MREKGDPDPVLIPKSPKAENLKKRIDDALQVGGQGFSTGNALRQACDWWKEYAPEAARQEETFLARKILLAVLDNICSDKPVSLLRGSKKQLIVGQRFWNMFGRCQAKGAKGLLDGSHETQTRPFHHLRVVSLKEDEWHVASKFTSNFRSFKKKARLSDNKTVPLHIGLFSFSKSVKTHFKGTGVLDSEGEIHGFLSDKVMHEEKGESGYLHDLLGCLQWASESNLHILVMPELSVCPKGCNAIQEEIARTSSDLFLVVPGSFHVLSKQHNGRYANAAPIWLVENRKYRELPSYEKHDPFSLEVSRAKDDKERLGAAAEMAKVAECTHLKEDIGCGSQVRLISTPVGIIAVTICKDFLFQNGSRREEAFHVADHLFVISMNPIGGPFRAQSWEHSYFCTAVYYVNAMQACIGTSSGQTPEVAFWQFPCKAGGGKEKYYFVDYLTNNDNYVQIDESGQVIVQGIAIPRKMFIE